MKIILKDKNRKIRLEAKKCGKFGMFLGLMFLRRKKASALLFDFKKPRKWKIHSLFVFFPFVAVWLDNKNNVIGIRKVEPWRFCIFPKKKFCKLVEIPLNNKYRRIVQLLDGGKI